MTYISEQILYCLGIANISKTKTERIIAILLFFHGIIMVLLKILQYKFIGLGSDGCYGLQCGS